MASFGITGRYRHIVYHAGFGCHLATPESEPVSRKCKRQTDLPGLVNLGALPDVNTNDHMVLSGMLSGCSLNDSLGPIDNEFMRSFDEYSNFRHEDMSSKLIDLLVEANEVKVAKDELCLIEALVSPSPCDETVEQYKAKQKRVFS